MQKLAVFLALAGVAVAADSAALPSHRISRATLLDKIRGAWAGQMVGVAYGAPTEFRFQGRINDAPIRPEPITNAIQQDDLYVEMTFAQVMDKVGLEATCADYGEAFRQSRYQLWHANAAARRNLERGLAAPLSGDPRYSLHTDDIDFQIESDFIGIMCPGLPSEAQRLADRVGRVMNRGDGLYGGMFIAGMYSAAFFESDPRRVVEAGLACIPADSDYGRVIRDVLDWQAVYPDDWRRVWQLLQEKWDRDDLCPEGVGRAFNIDAKLNGAYVALGLLAGGGDWQRTMEISTRCGQDSDCNPSSACGVLGTMLGFDRMPAADRGAVLAIADKRFDFTEYSFNEIVDSTLRRALLAVGRAGGSITGDEIVIPRQAVTPPPLETSGYGRPAGNLPADNPAWTWGPGWTMRDGESWGHKFRLAETTATGAVAEVRFHGTGIGLLGNLVSDGGRAEVYVDGQRCELDADAYVDNRLTHDSDLWRWRGLADGDHVLKLVTTGKADPRSTGTRLRITQAVIYRTTPAP